MADHKQTRNLDEEIQQLERELEQPMSSFMARAPRADETRSLIAALQQDFDGLKERMTPFDMPYTRTMKPSLLRQIRIQLHTYGKQFWLSSALMFLMLTLMNDLRIPLFGNTGQSLYSLVIPLMLVCGVLFSYRSWNLELRTVESVTPYPPALILMSRVMIMLMMCMVYGSASSAYLNYMNRHLAGMPFLMEWMSILILVCGVMLYIMFRKGVRWGIVSAVVVWLAWEAFIDWAMFQSGLAPVFIPLAHTALILTGVLLLLLAYRRSLTLALIRS